jgi:hypothetical protein
MPRRIWHRMHQFFQFRCFSLFFIDFLVEF